MNNKLEVINIILESISTMSANFAGSMRTYVLINRK